jgi:hypothetical protein
VYLAILDSGESNNGASGRAPANNENPSNYVYVFCLYSGVLAKLLVMALKQTLLLALLALVIPVYADVYRCVGADGATTYSQTPCSAAAEKVVVVSKALSTGTTDCAFAENFIRSTSRLMRQRVDKDRLIDQFGGPDAFDDGATKIVQYIYQYEHMQSMSQDRIVELAVTQCKTGAFGGVTCESLPKSYTDSGGGCGESFSADSAHYSVDVFAIHRAEANERQQASAELRKKQIEELSKRHTDLERGTQCRQKIEQQIFQIESRIYAGGDPNGQRLELKRLREKLGECGSYRSPPVIPPQPGGARKRYPR